MSKKQKELQFYWVDDDKSRVDTFTPAIEGAALPQGMKARVKPLWVEKNLPAKLVEWSGWPQPDLVIIDHVFSRAADIPLRMVGSSVAHLLRRAWPRVPMICVTAMYAAKPRRFDTEDVSEYTALFKYDKLDEHIEEMAAIARDFPLLNPKTGHTQALLAKLVKLSATERELFYRALPDEFRGPLVPTTHHRLARWLINELIGRPGFLYDELRTATLLGLNVKGFRKVERLFRKALYSGPFWAQSRPRWWVSTVQELLLKLVPSNGPQSLQEAGRKLPRLKPGDYSRCYVCENSAQIPDVVAQLYPEEEWRAVCSRHTQHHPLLIACPPGFEPWLIVSDQKSQP